MTGAGRAYCSGHSTLTCASSTSTATFVSYASVSEAGKQFSTSKREAKQMLTVQKASGSHSSARPRYQVRWRPPEPVTSRQKGRGGAGCPVPPLPQHFFPNCYVRVWCFSVFKEATRIRTEKRGGNQTQGHSQLGCNDSGSCGSPSLPPFDQSGPCSSKQTSQAVRLGPGRSEEVATEPETVDNPSLHPNEPERW